MKTTVIISLLLAWSIAGAQNDFHKIVVKNEALATKEIYFIQGTDSTIKQGPYIINGKWSGICPRHLHKQ